MSKLQELTDVILPRIAKSGRLGPRVQFVKCICDDSASGEAQFASSVCFLKAFFKSDQGIFEQSLLIKYNMGDEAVRNWLGLDYQFQNEVIVYEHILPALDKNDVIKDIFPQYFYGLASPSESPDKYILVLEDLRSSGFKLTSQVLDLNFDHCALAFKKLGIFHALSFAAKQLNKKAFFDVVNRIIETRLFDDGEEDANYLYGCSLDRASKPLLEKGEKVNEIHSFRNKLKNSMAYLRNVVAVEEPMGVICHGDFCRNNVLFKYDNDIPVDVKFFDLATCRYGSPMLDFSFFLLLNSSEESRKLYREQYLNIYYESLSSTFPEIVVPSLEDFRKEFLKKAVHGFLHCLYFKPAMMEKIPFNPSVEVHKSTEEKTATVLRNGGQKGTEVISNMLRELIDLKCIL